MCVCDCVCVRDMNIGITSRITYAGVQGININKYIYIYDMDIIVICSIQYVVCPTFASASRPRNPKKKRGPGRLDRFKGSSSR